MGGRGQETLLLTAVTDGPPEGEGRDVKQSLSNDYITVHLYLSQIATCLLNLVYFLNCLWLGLYSYECLEMHWFSAILVCQNKSNNVYL